MIKKLRFKFILISTLSIFLLLSLILLSVNISNYNKVAREADRFTYDIAVNGELTNDNLTPPMNGGAPNPNQNENGPRIGDIRREAMFDTRYFLVKFDSDSNVIETKTDRIASVNEAQAIDIATNQLSKKASTGWYKDYRFRVYEDSSTSTTTIVYVDYERELAPSRTVLISSFIVGSVGIVIAFVLIFFISNIVVKPVDDAFKKQKHFISNASHELKTPITIISANNQILEIEYGENESIDTINRQVRKLSNMIQELNNLSRLDEMDKLSEFAKFNLSNAATEVVEPYSEIFKKENKTLNINIDSDIEYKGNELLIKGLISTIMDNSLKYSVSYATFTVTKDNERIIIESKNDATELKNGNLNDVFERFYRTDEARANYEGSGIGLSIAKEVVNLHKGRISAYGENNNFNIKVEL